MQSQSLDTVRAVYEDKCMSINGRDYRLTICQFPEMREVFGYASKIQSSLENGDFSFMSTPEFSRVESILANRYTYEGVQISKLKDHWDKHPEDYLVFITMGMAAIGYPFMRGAGGV